MSTQKKKKKDQVPVPERRWIKGIILVLMIFTVIFWIQSYSKDNNTTKDDKDKEDTTEKTSDKKKADKGDGFTNCQTYQITQAGMWLELPRNFRFNPYGPIKVTPPNGAASITIRPHRPIDTKFDPGNYWLISDTTFTVALEVCKKN